MRKYRMRNNFGCVCWLTTNCVRPNTTFKRNAPCYLLVHVKYIRRYIIPAPCTVIAEPSVYTSFGEKTNSRLTTSINQNPLQKKSHPPGQPPELKTSPRGDMEIGQFECLHKIQKHPLLDSHHFMASFLYAFLTAAASLPRRNPNQGATWR